MARTPKETDFTVPVEGIGNFTFAKRTMADEIKIQVKYAEIIDGVEPTTWLTLVGSWISTLSVLTVRAPADWDIDELDPLDNETYAKLKLVFESLTEQERSFRRKPQATG